MAGQKKGQDFSHMTRDQLYEIARERNIPGKSSMNKEELMHALQKGGVSGKSKEHKGGRKSSRGEGPSAPGHGGGEGDTPQPKGAGPEEFKDIPGNQS